jgi:hypothetical protein
MADFYDQWDQKLEYSHNTGAGREPVMPWQHLVTDAEAVALLTTYSPRGVDRFKYVESGAHAVVVDAIVRARAFKTKAELRANARLFALLVMWAMAEGIVFRLEQILDPEVIERFLVTSKDLNVAVRTPDRLCLRRMSEKLTTNLWPPLPEPGRSYSSTDPLNEDEVSWLRDWADAQHIHRRWRAAQTCVLCGLGAGLSSAAAADLRKGDVVEYGDAVLLLIRGKFPRVVPVTRPFEDGVRKLAQGLQPYEYLHRPPGFRYKRATDLSALLDPNRKAFPVNPWRLHRTWLLNQVRRGTPLNVIVEAAGRKRESGHWILSLQQYLEDVEFDQYVELLRGPLDSE